MLSLAPRWPSTPTPNPNDSMSTPSNAPFITAKAPLHTVWGVYRQSRCYRPFRLQSSFTDYDKAVTAANTLQAEHPKASLAVQGARVALPETYHI